MAQFTLNNKETKMLKEVVVSYLSDLRMEIADTDKKDFREYLKTKEVFLKDLINRLIEN